MQEKDHRKDSVIGLALGMIVAALTTWLVMLFRQRSQRAGYTGAIQTSLAGMTVLETKPASPQAYQPENIEVQKPAIKTEPASMSRADAIPSSDKKTSYWSLPTKYMVGAGLVISILWILYFSRGSLTLIIFAGLISLVAGGVIDFFKKRLKMSRGLATALTYLLIVIILVSIPLLLLPPVIDAVSSLINIDWQALADNTVQRLDQTAAQVSTIPLIGPRLQDSITALTDLVEYSSTSAPALNAPGKTLESMAGTIGRTLGQLASILGPIISGVIALVFMLLLSLQMTVGGGAVRKGLVDVLPSVYREEIDHLLDGIIMIWNSFLRGQVLLMFVMGVSTWLLNVLLGTPQPLLLGFLAGFLEIIPSLGPLLAYIPAVILALLFGSTHFSGLEPWVFAVIVSVGYLLLSLMENQVLVPRIMGGAVDLPPLVVLVGVIIAGSTIGLAGIFLAVPVMATGKEVFLYLYGKVVETEGELAPLESTEEINRPFREFLQSARGRIRGWFGGSKNPPSQ